MPNDEPASRMKRKAYEREIEKLGVELCHLQKWVKANKARVIILFEGRDAAGKCGTIKRTSEKISPRVFGVTAFPAPSDREKSQLGAAELHLASPEVDPAQARAARQVKPPKRSNQDATMIRPAYAG